MAYFAYIRVSTNAQDIENQKHGIKEYCNKYNIQPLYVEDTASGKKDWRERQLGVLLDKLTKEDTLLVAEVSRLARSTLQVLEILKYAADREVNVYVVKNNLNMDGSLQSKITATVLGLAAEIEREFISVRTKEALAYRKAQGQHLGRPFGAKSKHYKVDKVMKKEIARRLKEGQQKTVIAKELFISRNTLYIYLRTLKVETVTKVAAAAKEEPKKYGLVVVKKDD
jgi:DNA invertase Pin-like site-specific DNA recombinase